MRAYAVYLPLRLREAGRGCWEGATTPRQSSDGFRPARGYPRAFHLDQQSKTTTNASRVPTNTPSRFAIGLVSLRLRIGHKLTTITIAMMMLEMGLVRKAEMKRRGFCTSCGARRMAEIAADLVTTSPRACRSGYFRLGSGARGQDDVRKRSPRACRAPRHRGPFAHLHCPWQQRCAASSFQSVDLGQHPARRA